MTPLLQLPEHRAAQLRTVQALVHSAIAMILVVHLLDGPVLSYSMSWAYLVVGAIAWIAARGRGRGAVGALRHAAAGAWCAALFVGAYPPWLLKGL